MISKVINKLVAENILALDHGDNNIKCACDDLRQNMRHGGCRISINGMNVFYYDIINDTKISANIIRPTGSEVEKLYDLTNNKSLPLLLDSIKRTVLGYVLTPKRLHQLEIYHFRMSK